MRTSSLYWDKELFLKEIRFEEPAKILEKITGQDKKGKTIEINKQYLLYKDLFGVQIESGSLRIIPVSLEDSLKFLNDFTAVHKKGPNLRFEIRNNIEALQYWLEWFSLEKPDLTAISGYLLNNELIRLSDSGPTTLSIKYKDKPENIFFIYKISFFAQKDHLFIILEKNI